MRIMLNPAGGHVYRSGMIRLGNSQDTIPSQRGTRP